MLARLNMAISQFVPFISLLTIVAIPPIQLSDSAGTMLDLIHRDSLPGCQNLTQAERIIQMLYRDMIRMQRIQNNNQQHVIKRQTLEAAVTPIASGYDYGTGDYFAELMVGTPAQKFMLVVDTGSELTWVDCQYKGINHKPAKVIFDADKSTSFRTIDCSSSTCKNDLSSYFYVPSCPQQNDSCPYDYIYGDDESAAAQGIFAYETVTFNLADAKTSAMNNTLIGCTNSSRGLESILTGANGIMGLGNNPFSLSNQASNLFGQAFSYCLADFRSRKTTPSKLFFGLPSQGMPKINGTMQNTALELGKSYPFYGVNIQSISIGGKLLNIPDEVWFFTGHGGTIIDSGSTLTYLLDSAYVPVINALAKSLSIFKNTTALVPFELCYSTGGFNDSAAPDMEFRFVDGEARFSVPGKSYLLDVGGGVKCVALVKSTSGYNIIGNMLQQNNLWVFDLKNEVLSFGSSSCTN